MKEDKVVTVRWKDADDGSAGVSLDTTLPGNEAAQVLLGGLLALMGVEDNNAVVDVVRTLNKYSNGGGAFNKTEGDKE